MVSFSTVFRSRVFLLGFSFILLALLMSAVAVFHFTPLEYSKTGTMGSGQYLLGNSTLEGATVTNRTLTLSSKNASVEVVVNGHYTAYNITGNLTLHPDGRPYVDVLSGCVTYTYRVSALDYPYSSLAIPAFVLAIVGTILAWLGLEKALRG